jgi:hypothetical protein
MLQFFGSFIPNVRDLDSRLEAATTYFSNLLEDKDRRLKIKLTLSLILRVNLRLGSYSILECEFNCTPYKRRLDNYSGHEHLTVSMQLSKYSEDTFKMKFGRTRRRLQKYSNARSTRLRRARGLVRPGHMGLRMWRAFSRIWNGTWPTLYICCNYS